MNNLNSTLKLRIDWSELDMFGHVNNVMFYKYIQSARVKSWEKIELYNMLINEKIGPLLASAKIDFKKPLLYPGQVTVNYGINFIKNTSFGLSYELRDDQNEIVATGEDVMVLMDFSKNVKIQVPEKLREELSKI